MQASARDMPAEPVTGGAGSRAEPRGYPEDATERQRVPGGQAEARDPGAPRDTLAGWGRVPVPGRERQGERLERITRGMPLTRGLGRSYGDASLPAPGSLEVAGSRLADRFLSFDPQSGLLRAEAGCTLGELSRCLRPQLWVSPVHTGTQYVTLGGMVAADVHGKNHHVQGTIGQHVRRLRMGLADGRELWCSREEHGDLFRATLGGMGLTGHILEVEMLLESIPSPWVWAETERIADLDHFLAGLVEAARGWPFTMGWLDCLARGRSLGRGILFRGRWAKSDEAPASEPQPRGRLTVPMVFPGWALNPLSVRSFNALYYRRQLRRMRRGLQHPEPFFHPLDAIGHWNRIYGPRGFTQYQCVLPEACGTAGVRRFLELLTRLGGASFLSVIKDCGAEGEGMLSFPQPGISVALDIPMRSGTQALVDRLNEQVIEEGGRIYLAKDALTRPEHFRAMEPRLPAFLEVQRRWDPEGRLASAQSARLFAAD